MRNLLLVVEANTTGTGMLALHKARSLGLLPIFLTNDPLRYKGLEWVECKVLVCDTNSIYTIMQTIAANVNFEELLGIITTSEFYLETVAQLAAIYNLPGNSPDSIRICHNKFQTRLKLENARIKQPRFAIARSVTDVSKALTGLGVPCVVKPADDSSSNGVRLCQDFEEVEEQVVHILARQTNVRGQRTAQVVLIEEFLDAPEFSVEMFTWRGKTTCIGITEKSLAGFPYFVEHRHIFPADLPVSVFEEMWRTVHRALEIVGVTSGATHTEIKLTQHGSAVVEINARLAGGMIPELIRFTTGIDLLENQLKSVIGEPPNLDAFHSGYAGIQFLIANREGFLEGVRGIENAQRVRGVEHVAVTALPGVKVSRPRSAYDRLGYVIVRAATSEEVATRLQEAIAELEILLMSTPTAKCS